MLNHTTIGQQALMDLSSSTSIRSDTRSSISSILSLVSKASHVLPWLYSFHFTVELFNRQVLLSPDLHFYKPHLSIPNFYSYRQFNISSVLESFLSKFDFKGGSEGPRAWPVTTAVASSTSSSSSSFSLSSSSGSRSVSSRSPSLSSSRSPSLSSS